MHFVYPKKCCISIVINLSWDDRESQEKLKTMLMQNVLGVNKVHYGQSGSGEFNFGSPSCPAVSTPDPPLKAERALEARLHRNPNRM